MIALICAVSPCMTERTRTGTYFEVPAAVAISLVVQTMISVFAAAIPVLAPDIVTERGWDAAVVAFYPTVVYVTAIVVSFWIPELLVSFGGMGLSLACIAISAAGMLCLLLPSAATATLAEFGIGCTTAAMNPASSQILGPRASPRTAGLIMAIKQTGVPLGGMVAGALVPVLVLQQGWRVAAVELAIIGTALALVLLPSVKWLNGDAAVAKPPAFRPLDPIKRLFAIPGMPSLLIASIAFNGMQLCLRSFFTIYLVTDEKLNLVTAGVVFSVSQAAGMVGQVIWAAISDRVFSVHAVMAIVGILMSGAALCTAAITPQWPLGVIIVVAIVYGLSAAGYVPVLLGEIARRSPPGQTGTLTSGAQLFPLGGSIVVPLAFGGAAAMLGMSAAFVLAAASTLLGVLILVLPHQHALGRTNLIG
jgi:MFS family permease